MVVVVKKGTDKQQLSYLVDWLKSMDIDVHYSEGQYETVLGLIGDTSRLDADLISGLDIVESVTRKVPTASSTRMTR